MEFGSGINRIPGLVWNMFSHPLTTELHELRRVQFWKRFSAKFVKFYNKFGSFNVQIGDKFKNIIFIVC